VDLTVRDLEPTARVLEEVFGFRRRYEHRESGARVSIFEVGPGGPGTEAGGTPGARVRASRRLSDAGR
jgi:hypothetical protein